MASGSSALTLLCACSIMLILLLADITAAHNQQQETKTGEIGSTQEFYLRGKTNTLTERGSTESSQPEVVERLLSEEELEARRELASDYYNTTPCANPAHDPSVCP